MEGCEGGKEEKMDREGETAGRSEGREKRGERRRKKILKITWMNLENIMLSESN